MKKKLKYLVADLLVLSYGVVITMLAIPFILVSWIIETITYDFTKE